MSTIEEQSIRQHARENFNAYTAGWLNGEYDIDMLAFQYSVDNELTEKELKPILEEEFQKWLADNGYTVKN